MIKEYHRPHTLEEALALLSRPAPFTIPLAGGTALGHHELGDLAVVDLQALGLDQITRKGSSVHIGAMVTLQSLLESGEVEQLNSAISLEATYNLRQVATCAGTVLAADGRSPLTTALLALDVGLVLQPGNETISLGDLLPFRKERLRSRLVTQINLPVNLRFAYEYVARTPADQPIVCAALAVWPSGRTRLALGGFGAAPTLAFDGTEPGGIEMAAHSAYSQAGDVWGSADYREEMAGVLARRCLASLS
jgi:CO/xanthine dehydrogenase FAD-binding subunit